MITIILHGCNGHMGRMISETAAVRDDMKIVAGVDLDTNQSFDYPVYETMAECKAIAADVIIDFSTARAVDDVVHFVAETKIPAVICTTGLTMEQQKKLEEVSKSAALLRSANMALGVNLMMKLAADAARVLADKGYDMEIVEKHHRRKVDAPSGTALAIADAVNAVCGGSYHYCYGRAERHEARDPKEIGISSVRGGTIPGDHDVIFAGEDEVLTISHTAYSRKIWAQGALAAAEFLAGKRPGYYRMTDVIGDVLR